MVGPVSCFARQFLQQVHVPRRIFVRLRFAHDRFAQNIHGESDFFFTPLAQCRYDVIGISSGNKLTSCFGNVPSQEGCAYPWSEARHTNSQANERVETIVAVAEIFFEMLNNLT